MSATGFAIWLYGSHARGAADTHSDLDLLVVKNELTDIEEIEHFAFHVQIGASLSVYTWNEIARMAAYGSLFLQHLKLEGIPLYETPFHRGCLRNMLDTMADYVLIQRDLEGFQIVLDDVAESLDNDGDETYELSVLGTVIRHSTILGCWLLKQPSFSRLEPISRFVTMRGIECAVESEFTDLYNYRLYADGRIGKEFLRIVSASRWLNKARCIVTNVEELTHERD